MEQPWIVIASVYSGRPDPRWEITAEQADRFTSLWNKAAPSEKEVTIPSRSGYKGVRIIADKKRFMVCDEIITCIEEQTKISKRDSNKAIERFLLSTAPEEIQKVLQQFDAL